jgi:hypothetical protein
MMGMNAGQLADAFNAADRKLNFGNLETVIKYSRQMTRELAFNLDIGSKTRAPSYQELYLWLPLQATGGLADGRNYIGNLDLSPERSNEIVLGLDWSGDRFSISPQAYYRDVSDYIQGVPATVMPANMLATMMSGNGALATGPCVRSFLRTIARTMFRPITKSRRHPVTASSMRHSPGVRALPSESTSKRATFSIVATRITLLV